MSHKKFIGIANMRFGILPKISHLYSPFSSLLRSTEPAKAPAASLQISSVQQQATSVYHLKWPTCHTADYFPPSSPLLFFGKASSYLVHWRENNQRLTVEATFDDPKELATARGGRAAVARCPMAGAQHPGP